MNKIVREFVKRGGGEKVRAPQTVHEFDRFDRFDKFDKKSYLTTCQVVRGEKVRAPDTA